MPLHQQQQHFSSKYIGKTVLVMTGRLLVKLLLLLCECFVTRDTYRLDIYKSFVCGYDRQQ
jgi:hypothetical protein